MISLIIPAYNEEKRIGRTLESYSRFFSTLKKEKAVDDFEIIIIINNTTDNTEFVVKSFMKKCREIRYLNFRQGGKGFAVKEGFKAALKSKAELIGYVDADMATSPESYFSLIKSIDGYDGIIASRYLKGSEVAPKFTFRRLIVNRCFMLLVKSLFNIGYKDTQCGAKLFKRKTIEKVLPKLTMSQWAFDIDLLYTIKKQGFKIREHPTVWKEVGGSKLKLGKSSIQMFLAVIQLRVLTSPLKNAWRFFSPIAGFIWKVIK